MKGLIFFSLLAWASEQVPEEVDQDVTVEETQVETDVAEISTEEVVPVDDSEVAQDVTVEESDKISNIEQTEDAKEQFDDSLNVSVTDDAAEDVFQVSNDSDDEYETADDEGDIIYLPDSIPAIEASADDEIIDDEEALELFDQSISIATGYIGDEESLKNYLFDQMATLGMPLSEAVIEQLIQLSQQNSGIFQNGIPETAEEKLAIFEQMSALIGENPELLD
jgi:hypothetical protein